MLMKKLRSPLKAVAANCSDNPMPNPNKNIYNKIFYTTSYGMRIETPTTDFGANILSNTYDNGKGVITFDGAVTTIGNSAFEELFLGILRLTSITIPESVTTIGESAFSFCELTSITIPQSVTTIGKGAFRNCKSLTSFYGK